MSLIPCDVPQTQEKTFTENYSAITKGTKNLFLFAGDQKMEHLSSLNPEDLFAIASAPHIGAFATHLGLINRYGKKYPTINYIAKLNGKTNLIPTSQQDPLSLMLWGVEDVLEIKEACNLHISGVGYTIYLGSEYQTEMLQEAAQLVHEAHQHGLIAILWIYPRGKAVQQESHAQLLAGAAGVATSLGADFVKIKAPQATSPAHAAELIQLAVRSAGNTKVICAGGERQEPKQFLTELHTLLSKGNIAGAAVGRNIYEHDFLKATQMAQAISELVYHDCSLSHALGLIKE